MSIFVSFVSGAALFYLHRFFPFSSSALFLILFSVFAFSKYRHFTLPFFPSPQREGNLKNPSPLGGEGRGEGSAANSAWLLFAISIILPLIFISLGYYRAQSSYVVPPDYQQLAGQVIEIQARPSSESIQLQSDRIRYMTEVEIVQVLWNSTELPISKMRLFTDFPLSVEKRYSAEVKIPNDGFFINPGSKDYMLSGYALEITQAGIANRNFSERARSRLNAYLAANFKGDVSAFIMSIITGERGSMSSEMRNAFNVTGLAHILSISGAHFGLLLFILFKLFKLLVKLLPHRMLAVISLYVSPSQIAAILCLPIITAYLGISTMEFPAVRAFIMITLFLCGLLIQRKGCWLNTLLFAAALIVLIQPDSLLQLSFQLSFLAVLSLGFYSDYDKRKKEKQNTAEEKILQESGNQDGNETDRPLVSMLRKIGMSIVNYLVASSLISLAATAGTAPLVAYSFNYFSIISPLSNLIVTPFIGFIVLPLSLASSFVYLFFGFFPFRDLIEMSAALSLEIIRYMGTWKFAAIPVASFPVALLIAFYSGMLLYTVIVSQHKGVSKKWIIASIALAILPLVAYAGMSAFSERGMKVTFVDVGQGDGAVVELPDKKVMVVDTGKNGFQIANFLKYRGFKKIDLLVLTHEHPDHCGGLGLLLNNFQIGEIWDNGSMNYPAPVPNDVLHKSVSRGDYVKGNGYSITVFHPYKGFYSTLRGDQDENDYSVALKIQGKANSFLFTGDISEEAEQDLAHLQQHLKSTVIKVPHHGSRHSLVQQFLYEVSPKYAVISSGKHNMYGHPHADTLDAYSRSLVYRTDVDGAVGVEERSDGTLNIKTAKEVRLAEAQTIEDEYTNIKRLLQVW